MLSVDGEQEIELSSAGDFFDDDENTDVEVDSHSMLGVPKYYFNRQNGENISGPRPGIAVANLSFTPEYMLELYDKLSKGSPAAQTSNIVRSFKNIPRPGE